MWEMAIASRAPLALITAAEPQVDDVVGSGVGGVLFAGKESYESASVDRLAARVGVPPMKMILRRAVALLASLGPSFLFAQSDVGTLQVAIHDQASSSTDIFVGLKFAYPV